MQKVNVGEDKSVVENLQKRTEEIQKKMDQVVSECKDEILKYKGKIATMDYEIKSKNSQVDLLTKKIRIFDQNNDLIPNKNVFDVKI